tara:strand:+ start:828 stop:1877 length:1050 start_codon:yes stop_codon:yes gene_type:complete
MMDSAKIKEVLIELGYNLHDRGEYWQATAKYRDGDNQTALQIYKNTGVWKDHVRQTSFSPFKALVEKTLGTKNKTVIEKYIGEGGKEPAVKTLTEIKGQKITMEETYDEEIIKKLLPHFSFYNKRGISDQTLKQFKSGLATKGQMYHRYVFPIYNEHGKIHGFAGRDVRTGSDPNRPKWKHMGRKTNWIYPYYVNQECKDAVSETQEVIIVESIGDAINLYENGVKNVLVSFGLDISNKLSCFLVSLSLSKITISFNNDSFKSENRGLQAAIKNYLKLLNFFDPKFINICLPSKNDFGDMMEEDIEKWKIKYDNIDTDKQMPHIIKEAEAMQKKGLLKKALNKKLNEIK